MCICARCASRYRAKDGRRGAGASHGLLRKSGEAAVTSAAHSGRRRADTCGAATHGERARSNGEWERASSAGAQRGRISPEFLERVASPLCERRPQAAGFPRRVPRTGETRTELSAARRRSERSHFSQGRAEGQGALAGAGVLRQRMRRSACRFTRPVGSVWSFSCEMWVTAERSRWPRRVLVKNVSAG